MSFKSMAADGKIKKTDLFRVKHEDFKVEPGFNLRDLTTPERQQHIDSIFQTLMNGGAVPPLEVRVDSSDAIFIVDGHCRHAAYGKAIKAGAPIEFIPVIVSKGNDADRTAAILTSSQGDPLTPLEISMGYKRLASFEWETAQIAKRVGKSEEHVKLLLVLANADTAVQKFVRLGSISAYAAIELVRKHGDKTSAIIAAEIGKAKASGKDKVTKGAMTGRALPKKIVSELMTRVADFTSGLAKNTRVELAALETMPVESLAGKTVTVDAAALLSLLKSQQTIDDARSKQSEKALAKDAAMRQKTLLQEQG